MLKSLASLRFVFAFLVFLHHIKVLEDAIGHAFFYALSGFILSYVYAERITNKKISLSRFLKLRLSRLYPLYFLTLLAAIPLTLEVFAENSTQWWMSFLAAVFMLQSFIPDASYYFSFNSVAWSISDLFFFYFLFPVLLRCALKLSKTFLVLFFIASSGVILVFMITTPEYLKHWFFYINPFLRIFDFGLGILLYKLLRKDSFQVYKSVFTYYELAAIALLILFYVIAESFPKVVRYSVYYWLPMTLFIGVFAQQKGIFSRLLSNKVALFLGELSFGFYLWHQLILRYARRFVNHYEVVFPDWQFNTLSFIVILLVCMVSYQYFELPLKQKIRRVWL
ncbi:acyltransferase family protein [Leeuwenhoekiella marinoflava]|uniref:Peptidoglycan/LPS O-acetylase OafA/YrhL n=2 Tax=Leeuwenhoekiella marinoflava TaxID=988 RepID=A0A4Q0PLM2_9FLAO|nr:acyltransferase [Leeuwenhoekiella marinoflava]RXG29958.1 peptidoglycan/LPS O-acetylase OafA/YrhL [Leeuwenhoekiella marinoflava]SHF25182.1 Peptidoglycan/LPS O-acetylase OafA/YrhL, contains acyltransferase and SGNH-hydrolase domains [Leeuwenhoekiella marinoflava DSM 3653]